MQILLCEREQVFCICKARAYVHVHVHLGMSEMTLQNSTEKLVWEIGCKYLQVAGKNRKDRSLQPILSSISAFKSMPLRSFCLHSFTVRLCPACLCFMYDLQDLSPAFFAALQKRTCTYVFDSLMSQTICNADMAEFEKKSCAMKNRLTPS